MFACLALLKHTHLNGTPPPSSPPPPPRLTFFFFLSGGDSLVFSASKDMQAGRQAGTVRTGRTSTDTLPVNLLQPQSHTSTRTHTHTRTHAAHALDWSQSPPSACVCMLAYCTRECVILMCECEWMGVEMSLLIFGKYRRSGCYTLSGPTFLWRKFRVKFVLRVQFGLKSLRAFKASALLFLHI